jgi:hypothetical protein
MKTDRIKIILNPKIKISFKNKPITAECLGCKKISRYDFDKPINCCKNKGNKILEIVGFYNQKQL